ncbi:MAG: Na/Pi symporter [Bacteroidales bacterium]|nr:Na/Pi symporter [Bacteroidales bacterium]
MTINIVLRLLGALALLIYGMKTMSDALQKMAGSGLRHILGRMTSNRFTGMLTGTFVTCAVQSSSATTVMTVSFVSAGLLTLAQAISVIMGANIGTTLTAWIMSFGYNVDLTNVVFPSFLVGIVLIYRRKHRTAGDFLFGLAFMFWSLVVLNGAGRDMDMQHNTSVVGFFASFDTGSYLTIFVFLLAGTIITCLVQSSAAVMAITILLCSTGVLPIYMGIALVMGENIGTTATANLAALGAGIEARRAALAHLLFNVFGVIWVLAVFYPFVDMVCSFVGYNPAESGQAERLPVVLAMFHTCFNVLNTALLIGFVPVLERIVCRILPNKNASKPVSSLRFISSGLMATPEISVFQAQKEVVLYAERMQRMFGMVCVLLDEKDEKEFEWQYARITKYENIADNMEVEITAYLKKVSMDHLSDDTKDKIQIMLSQTGELESIGDACYKTAKAINRLRNGREDFSDKQYEGLHEMMRLVNEAITQMMVVVGGRRNDLTIDHSQAIERDINTLRDRLKTDAINAVNDRLCSSALGSLYSDIVSDCEKLGDYVMNVVEVRLGKRLLSYRGLYVNIDKKSVTVDGVPAGLTRTEFDLLCLLLVNRGKVLTRTQLLNSIWSDVVVTERTVNINITRLRKKLGVYARNIESRQGVGYMFNDDLE